MLFFVRQLWINFEILLCENLTASLEKDKNSQAFHSCIMTKSKTRKSGKSGLVYSLFSKSLFFRILAKKDTVVLERIRRGSFCFCERKIFFFFVILFYARL